MFFLPDTVQRQTGGFYNVNRLLHKIHRFSIVFGVSPRIIALLCVGENLSHKYVENFLPKTGFNMFRLWFFVFLQKDGSVRTAIDK